jgi:hypothetical protein
MRIRIMLVALAVVALAGVSRAEYIYTLDDGWADTGISEGAGFDAIFLNQFDAVAGETYIKAIRVSVGWPGFNNNVTNHAITLAVWSDPNQDGSPSDATVLAQFNSTISNVNDFAVGPPADSFNTFNLPAPVYVSGKFFAGYMISVSATDTNGNPNSMIVERGDTNAPQHQSWIAEAPYGTGTSYFNDLGNAGLPTPIMNMDVLSGYGFPIQNAMIQAVTPEPGSLGLMAFVVGGAFWIRQRRRNR